MSRTTADLASRLRRRIRARLDELNMTARELARAVRPDATANNECDAWISGVLKGTQGLQLKYLDAIADKLRLTPAELVRREEDTVRELTPPEMALLRHYQAWPPEIQRRWLEVVGYFTTARPDPDTAAIVERIQSHPPSLRRPVMAWLTRLLEEGIPLEFLRSESDQGSVPAGDLPGSMPRVESLRTLRAARLRAAGRQK